MATSGPITYLVMEDQFLSVAARRKRLPQSTGMSSPLIGVCGRLERAAATRQNDQLCAVQTASLRTAAPRISSLTRASRGTGKLPRVTAWGFQSLGRDIIYVHGRDRLGSGAQDVIMTLAGLIG